jgi:hypothetical protein
MHFNHRGWIGIRAGLAMVINNQRQGSFVEPLGEVILNRSPVENLMAGHAFRHPSGLVKIIDCRYLKMSIPAHNIARASQSVILIAQLLSALVHIAARQQPNRS